MILWGQTTESAEEIAAAWQPRRKTKKPYHAEDLPPCVQYLIIGSGVASWSAYRAIMKHDKKAKVFFITKEDAYPYKMPPMSKEMWFNKDPPDIKSLRYVQDGESKSMYFADCEHFMEPLKFYQAKEGPAVSIAVGWCVLSLDADDHAVYVKTNTGHQRIYYERCLLAPGVRPKRLHMFKSASRKIREKVCYLHGIRDFEKAFRRVQAAKHVTVVGGGVLGTELAFHLGRMNKKIERAFDMPPLEITHVLKDKGVLSSIVPEYLGEWAAERIKCEGVQIIPKAQVYDASLTPDERIELTLSNGESIITDYVFCAVGCKPRIEIGDVSDLELDPVNGGYLVNTELQARTHLYVAGDAASVYLQWKNNRQRMEHYENAEEMGYIAGANMTGYWVPCNFEQTYEVVLEDELHAQVIGEVGACMPTIGLFKPCEKEVDMEAKKHEEEFPHDEFPCYKKTPEYKNRYKRGLLFYLREETVVGIVCWNIPYDEDRRAVATEILRAKPSYKDINILAELLGFDDVQCTYKLAEEPKPQPKKKRKKSECAVIKNRRYTD